MKEQWEIKCREAGDNRPWEMIPVKEAVVGDRGYALFRAKKYAELHFTVEARYNLKHNYQGHYVPGREEAMERHRVLVNRKEGGNNDRAIRTGDREGRR